MKPADDPFLRAFNGGFTGILRWHQLDALWTHLKGQADRDWYVYAVGEAPPETATDGHELVRFLDEVYTLLRREHEEDYCGIVYVDDPAAPSFVKIYDPNNLGVVCGYSEQPPLPGWILSTLKPVDLPAALHQPANRRRWWKRIFSLVSSAS